VDNKTQRVLIELNHQFYQRFASQFSSTRMRLQPGVLATIKNIKLSAVILDLGCGNGELYKSLIKRNFVGKYIGIDASPKLIEIAKERSKLSKTNTLPQTKSNQAIFLIADITSPKWGNLFEDIRFDYVFSFAVLHHIPGENIRKNILSKIHDLLKPDGKFIHSEWQFLNSPRLRKRIHPWDEINLTPEQLDEGDYLLDWRQGGFGFRYVHHFNEEELQQLASATNYRIVRTFYSDGAEGNLGLYQVWEPKTVEN